jgi:hypothetical protein
MLSLKEFCKKIERPPMASRLINVKNLEISDGSNTKGLTQRKLLYPPIIYCRTTPADKSLDLQLGKFGKNATNDDEINEIVSKASVKGGLFVRAFKSEGPELIYPTMFQMAHLSSPAC